MQHHIFQFETLGQNAFTCPVLDLTYYNFDWSRFKSVMEPYRFSELVPEIQTIKFNVVEQVKKFGYIPEDQTIDWWKAQGSMAKDRIRPSEENDVSLKNGMLTWINDLPNKNKGIIWSKGNNFHNVIADRIIRNLVIQTDKFSYWSARDLRTFIDTKFDFTTTGRLDFSPFQDEAKWAAVYNPYAHGHKLAADIMRLQTITRAEADLDIISG